MAGLNFQFSYLAILVLRNEAEAWIKAQTETPNEAYKADYFEHHDEADDHLEKSDCKLCRFEHGRVGSVHYSNSCHCCH